MTVRAKRSLGQNFLCDQSVVDRVVDALGIDSTDTVVEIGPGLGALTSTLLDKAARVIAIEFDRDLIEPLRQRFHGSGKLFLINADALHLSFADIPEIKTAAGNIKLAANLPYNISTPILQRLIEQRHLFSRLVLMFQREVMARITAAPGTKDRGYLSVLVENAFNTERLFDVPPTAFRPAPKVWSGVVRLTPKRPAMADEAVFREILSAAFAQKRKTILNNLKGKYGGAAALLQSSGIDGRRRAETLSLDEWVRLTDQIASNRFSKAI
jgi:16S rRNA (adenine1518-N6/adenine1519-N6)-dimethyltransferase